MKYNRIALLFAMYDEALPLINYFDLKKIEVINPIEVYSNSDKSLIISLNGKSKEHGVDNIGSQAAAINAFVIINNFQPELIINCGTAGGFSKKNANIGDVFIADKKVCYHDRRIPIPGGYEEYGLGNYKVINSDLISQKFNLKQGVISTGDSFDISEADKRIMQQNNVEVKEMEAAAIAWVCSLYNVDFTAIKAITDFVDLPEKTSKDFLSNLEIASNKLKEKVIEVIGYFKV